MSSSDEELLVRNPFTAPSSGGERRSSRRVHVSRHKETQSKALEEVRRARASGLCHRIDVDSLIKPVYEEVDEDEYINIVRERQSDDFVVDDDGSGYVDHGVDIFDDDQEMEAESTMKRKREKKEKPVKGKIDDFLSVVVPKKRKDENAVSIENDPDVIAMLNECDFDNPLREIDNGEEHRPRPLDSCMRNPFKRTRSPSPIPLMLRPVKAKLARIGKSYLQSSEEMNLQAKNSDSEKSLRTVSVCKPEEVITIQTESGTTTVDSLKSSRAVAKDEGRVAEQQRPNDFNKNDDLLTIRELKLEETNNNDGTPEVNMNAQTEQCTSDVSMADIKQQLQVGSPTERTFSWDDDSMTPAVDDSEDNEVKDGITKVATTGESFICVSKDGGNSVVRFYWLDAFEDPVKFPGTVYLFGRVINNGITESCCIIVKNIWRQVFFLARETRFVNGVDTGEKVDFLQMNNEVQSLLKQMGVTTVKCRPAKKRFAFNDGIVPKNAEVLEVQYSSGFPKLSTEMKGATFSHVFNTTATAMERLLLEADMRGPSWIEVSDYVVSSPQQTYAKHEFIVDMERMKSINVVECVDPIPSVTLMAFKITTMVNEKKEGEVVMISYIIDAQCNLNKPTMAKNRLERYCLLTKSSNRALPFDLPQRLNEANINTRVFEASNERHLLSQFLCRLQDIDPDILLGHDMPTQLSSLVNRLEKLKIAQWSRTSRLKRSVAIKQLGRSKAAHWELTAGRLVVDSRLSAMELVKSRSYDLGELSSSLLGITAPTRTLQTAESFSNSRQLISAIEQSWQDAWTALAITAKLNALPLFVQITQTVGGVLSRTLMGGRAERNEFLLLHAFHKAGYVPPNKHQYEQHKKKGTENTVDDGEQKEANDEKSGKKAQYMGGLVLEPKKGLYDKYVLLLDFNSLYPSIIQEYNICFTTVDQSRRADDSELPKLPDDQNEGILPRQIRILVERRRDVKNLMKSDKLSEHQRQQYNIRQMALKLTANSMYGCLGFPHCRFYAKPLAALITSRGREILMHTKDLVEKQGYAVIYGDTDSIMIDTGLDDLNQVKKLGFELKRMVNKCHKKLELDIDGVYKRLLLLKKKKYAGLAVDLNDETKMEREMKGLDIVRRDWSVLAKDIGNEIVGMILSISTGRDELVEHIHERLRAVRKELDDGLVDMCKFEIMKQLTRDPSEYADIKAQPHAAVALRLNETGQFHFHRGDIVSYIICEDGTGNSAAQRAYHRSEIASRSELVVDILYYLAQQVHPVVCRLCEPIEETDAIQIAQALGIDSSAYHSHATINKDNDDLSLEFAHNFSRCRPFTFLCPYKDCGTKIEVRKTLQGEGLNVHLWLDACPQCKRSLLSYADYLTNQLCLAQMSAIREYYKSSFTCEDVVCAYRTRMHVLSWSREGAVCPKCHVSIMRREKTAAMLFEQQSFFHTLFDLPNALRNCTSEQQKKLRTRKDSNEVFSIHAGMLEICNGFLARNDFNRVSLAYLFSSMRTGVTIA